jgi:hypothetical protein
MTLPLPSLALPKNTLPVPSLAEIRSLLPKSYKVLRSISGNMSGYPNHADDLYGSWEAIVQAGKSYLYGERYPLASYLQRSSSPLRKWQQAAFLWAHAHPTEVLIIESSQRIWRIGLRGEFVQFDLPHHHYGGERSWASLDGKSRLLINLD